MTDTHPTTWSEVRQQIDRLRLYAVELTAVAPDAADFMPAFAAEADIIVDAASAVSDDALDTAHKMIDEILIELGYMDASERQT